MARKSRRWLPAGTAVVLVAGAVAFTSQAGAADLPERSPHEVLTMLAEHDVDTFSGTFETSANLGLPVPGEIDLGPGGSDLAEVETHTEAPAETSTTPPDSLAILEMFTGQHTGRVFVGGPDQMRLQQLDDMNERNVILSDQDLWLYDSRTNEATHVRLPDSPPDHGATPHAGTPRTPDEMATAAIEALQPSTEMAAGPTAQVAGRDAYGLDLQPRAPESLIESINIAVDGETGFPLAITVTAEGRTEPAFHAAYTDIDFSAPDASLFDFTPPAGATVEEETLEWPSDLEWPNDHPADCPDAPDHPDADVLGEAWTSVVVMPEVDPQAEEFLNQITEPVDGGRMLSSALVSVLLTDDGRVLAGAVTPEHLLSLAEQ
ncbi:MAG TPA: DUF2092 domain-containing protein [Beutenbergiaceae bacterium]|nr:DUF2092 domain-containing protein [Beutenbergiaceae bacterium]